MIQILYKYCANIWQTLCKYCKYTAQIIYKLSANIEQILCKYNYTLFIYCTIAVQVSTKYWANTIFLKSTQILQILQKFCSIIVKKKYYNHYSNKYCPNEVRKLSKYCTNIVQIL